MCCPDGQGEAVEDAFMFSKDQCSQGSIGDACTQPGSENGGLTALLSWLPISTDAGS